MLDPAEALDAILAAMPRLPDEAVSLSGACGRVLREQVVAERDQPPFDRVTMDGIALRHAALSGGRRRFAIHGTQHAGDAQQTLAADDACIEVMTGSVLPAGSDCVIPVERIRVAEGTATVEDTVEAVPGQFVHRQGTDHGRGQALLAPGQRITALDVAVIASAGLDRLRVSREPVVRVISTGNELVAAGDPIAPHQIRLSNGPALVAMLAAHGVGDIEHEHLPDRPETLRRRIGEHLAAADVLVLSGGVSMGKADYVPQVLAELGVDVVFHNIAQRPGKPMWFGTAPAGQAVFALPGNPVSTLTCCRHYVLPALCIASGQPAPEPGYAVLAEDVEFDADLTCFLPVKVTSDRGGSLRAKPVPTNTSGDFAALSGTDGYVELPRKEQRFAAGSVQLLHRWRLDY